MIEPTDEMLAAFEEAAGEAPANTCAWDFGNNRAGLAAVLAIIERDYDVHPKLPRVEHRPKGDIWWNHSSEAYQSDCVCGEEFTGRSGSDAEDRLLDHLERETGRA